MNKYQIKNKIDEMLFYFPYNIYSYTTWKIKRIINSQLRLELAKNKGLKDKYIGKRCFIIGNGPSLKTQDLTLLRNEYTFVTNNFILHEQIEKINPDFYCIVDPNMYNGNFPIERLKMIEKILPEVHMFFRIDSKNYVNENGLFKNRLISYLYSKAYLQYNYPFSIDLDKNIPAAINVVHTCIMIAAYMGFKEIYLVGCDATLFIPQPDHFYKLTEEEKLAKVDLEEKLQLTSYMFRSYKILKEIYNSKDVNIYNATNGGVLEIYPRVKYESLFK